MNAKRKITTLPSCTLYKLPILEQDIDMANNDSHGTSTTKSNTVGWYHTQTQATGCKRKYLSVVCHRDRKAMPARGGGGDGSGVGGGGGGLRLLVSRSQRSRDVFTSLKALGRILSSTLGSAGMLTTLGLLLQVRKSGTV